MISEVTCEDNMIMMARYPDKFFDLAIIDVPYGIGHSTSAGRQSGQKYGNAAANKRIYKEKDWDNSAPDNIYFSELLRVSKNQIIWGANHFISKIPIDSPCWIVWDKDNGDNNFADCELAYTSFKSAVRKFKYTWNGMIQGDMKNKESRFHPTQKPVKLYEWVIMNYGNKGDKLLDTNMGSQSSRIAAHNLGFDFYGCELDEDYFKEGCKRFDNHILQQRLF